MLKAYMESNYSKKGEQFIQEFFSLALDKERLLWNYTGDDIIKDLSWYLFVWLFHGINVFCILRIYYILIVSSLFNLH